MNWRKLGLIFSPTGQFAWMQSHAAVPISLQLNADLYRVYFACRDGQNHSHIGYVELDITQPQSILYTAEQASLAPGAWGYFDDSGVFPGTLVHHDGQLYMYYCGRSNGERPLFYMAIGLAKSQDGGKTFEKVSKAPLMARSEHDPWIVSTPFVLKENDLWRMWYLSGLGWFEEEGQLHSRYHIKYAESDDGIHWQRDGRVCIDFREGETNISCPTLVYWGGKYRMWYSYVLGKQGYRIGYAESDDGYAWTRLDDQAGIDVSPTGWDSQTLAYPHVFIHDGQLYMLYSGNNFGGTGFGLAVEQS